MATSDPEQDLADAIISFRRDPVKFTQFAYEWGEGELSDSKGPRDWQRVILDHIGGHLRDKKTRFTPCQVAVASGHGIGKSSLISMVMQWAMSTCLDCKIVVTANTFDQLRTKTWPEVTKWQRLAINHHWWEATATKVSAVDKEHCESWRADAVTWSEKNTEAFQGLHNKGKRIVLIFDEASAIADKVWEVSEGALTDEDTEIIWLAFGNPTRNTGRFRECFGRLKHRWKTFQIDSRTVEGTNKAQLDKYVEDYGEDSDFVRVRVRGEFPRAGSSQFIPSDVVANARRYRAEGFDALPKVLSVDVARFGDDQTVIGIRQGRKSRILAKLRGLDTVQVALRTMEFMDAEKPDATVIDGDGIGAGVIDQINARGYGKGLFEFHGGEAPQDPAMYFNRRAEVWGAMRDWLVAGAEIPDDPELETDLTAPEYGFSNKQQIQLEKKDDMKRRGLSSPDCGDMLAMTFSVKIGVRAKVEPRGNYYGAAGWMA